MEVKCHWYRNCFFVPPKEAETNVWLLKKCVYGLGDASCKRYNRVKSFLLSIGLKMSKGDPSIFYYYNGNVLQGLIAIFVDDFLWSGTNDFETSYISKLRKNFVIGKENHCFSISGFTPRRKWFWNYFRPDELFKKLETNSF